MTSQKEDEHMWKPEKVRTYILEGTQLSGWDRVMINFRV